MKHCNSTCAATSVRQALHAQSRTRFVDWHNLPKPTWREALQALAAPAARMHRYRNLRTLVIHQATSTLDSKDCS